MVHRIKKEFFKSDFFKVSYTLMEIIFGYSKNNVIVFESRLWYVHKNATSWKDLHNLSGSHRHSFKTLVIYIQRLRNMCLIYSLHSS